MPSEPVEEAFQKWWHDRVPGTAVPENSLIRAAFRTAWAQATERAARVAETICQHPHKGTCEFGRGPKLIAQAIRQPEGGR